MHFGWVEFYVRPHNMPSKLAEIVANKRGVNQMRNI